MGTLKKMGKRVIIKVKPTGEMTFTDIGALTRSFSIEDQGNEIDTTTRGSTAKEGEADYPDLSGTLGGLQALEDEGGTPALEKLPRDSTGEMEIYDEGVGTGLPKETVEYKVLGVSRDYPYDNAVTFEISLRFTSEPVVTTQV